MRKHRLKHFTEKHVESKKFRGPPMETIAQQQITEPQSSDLMDLQSLFQARILDVRDGLLMTRSGLGMRNPTL